MTKNALHTLKNHVRAASSIGGGTQGISNRHADEIKELAKKRRIKESEKEMLKTEV